MTTTTYPEFERSPNREPRVFVLLTVKNASSGFLNFIRMSTIAGHIPGLTPYCHGVIGKVPTISYSSKEISGALPIPTYSDLELIIPDGYDLSPDQSGIYIDDIGSTWIAKDQNVSILFGGDELPISEYRPMISSGTVTGIKKTDTGAILSVAGAEREIYSKNVATNKITSVQWPNAGQNIGKSKPVCIGYVDNITPLVVNNVGNPTYLFNENSSYIFLQVYEDGVLLASPASYTDNGDGTLTTTYVPTGQITCDVFGITNGAWATMITTVLQTYGGVPPGSIDAAAVAAADLALPYHVSYFVSEETPVMDVISQMSQGIPAWWGFDQDAIFTMAEVVDPSTGTAAHKITNKASSEIPIAFIDNTCTESPSGEVVWKIDYDFWQNYTPTPSDRLSAALTLAQKTPFVVKWQTIPPVSDTSVLTNYPFALSIKKVSRVFASADATAVANKWLALEKVERKLTNVIVPMMATYEIGDIVELTYETKLPDGTTWYRHRYNAKKMLILDVKYDLNNYTIKLGLWS